MPTVPRCVAAARTSVAVMLSSLAPAAKLHRSVERINPTFITALLFTARSLPYSKTEWQPLTPYHFHGGKNLSELHLSLGIKI